MPDRISRTPSIASTRSLSLRTLAASVALALATLSGNALAAGLGRLTVQSSLGQPLRAEVELLSVARDEAASLVARLAPVDAYRQAGIEFGPALQSLRFAVERRADGRHVVRITSAQPVSEPFVDLLLQLDGAGGRYLRQYTFLLDPPELRSLQAAAAPGEDTAAEPVVVSPVVPSAEPAGQGATARAATVRAPTRRAATARAATESGEPSSILPLAAGSEYVVRRGDTLAALARRMRPADGTAEQTAAAIYRANPAAFQGGPDLLREGASIRVPEPAAVAAVAPEEARRELRLRIPDSPAQRERLAATPGAVEPSRPGPAASGQLEARASSRGPQEIPRDQLKLTREAGTAAGAAGDRAARGVAAEERGIARDAAIAEVDARVRQLERTLGDLQKLIELKDRSLASMQRELEVARGGAPGATVPVAAGTAGVPATTADASVVTAPGTVSTPTTPSLPAAAEPAGSPTPAGPSATPGPSVPKGSSMPPGPPAPAGSEPGLADELLGGSYLLPALGGLALLGLGFAWTTVRRRRRAPVAQAASLDAAATSGPGGGPGSGPGASLPGQSAGPSGAADTLGLPRALAAAASVDVGTEPSPSEVDPIAEAEVYVAYGREQQAEEILREALRRHPERQAVRARLMELVATRRDAQAFGELAGEMYTATRGMNDEWPKLAALGRSLDPGNPLYENDARRPVELGLAPTVAAAPAAFGAPAAPSTKPAPATEPAPSEPPVPELPPLEPEVLRLPPLDTVSATLPPQDEIAPLEFELDLDSAIGRSDRADPAAEAVESLPERMSELAKALGEDFGLEPVDEAEAVAARAVAAQTEAAALARAAQVQQNPPPATPAPAQFDLSSISLDLGPADASDGKAASQGAGGDARWQELSTKLDLAAAYEEIGDREGARELLEEVLREGDAQQRQRAQAMIDKLG